MDSNDSAIESIYSFNAMSFNVFDWYNFSCITLIALMFAFVSSSIFAGSLLKCSSIRIRDNNMFKLFFMLWCASLISISLFLIVSFFRYISFFNEVLWVVSSVTSWCEAIRYLTLPSESNIFWM